MFLSTLNIIKGFCKIKCLKHQRCKTHTKCVDIKSIKCVQCSIALSNFESRNRASFSFFEEKSLIFGWFLVVAGMTSIGIWLLSCIMFVFGAVSEYAGNFTTEKIFGRICRYFHKKNYMCQNMQIISSKYLICVFWNCISFHIS